MNEPLVSICLCTYNGVVFLKEQIESILNQTYRNIELIVVDDVSSDDSVDIIRSFAFGDARVKYFVNTHNLGFAANFEKAIGLASGELVALSDQDDYWLPEKIEILVKEMDDNCLMVYHDSMYMERDGRLLHRTLFDHKNHVNGRQPLPFLYDNCVTGHTILFRSSLVENIVPIPDGYFHDWWIAYVAATCGNIQFLPKVLVHYRFHENNQTDLLGTRKNRNHHPKKREDLLSDTNHKIHKFSACLRDFLPESQQVIIRNLILAYRDKTTSFFFSFPLFFILIKHPSLLFLHKRTFLKRVSFILSESIGLGLKGMFYL